MLSKQIVDAEWSKCGLFRQLIVRDVVPNRDTY